MSKLVNARIPPRVEEKLAEYCAKAAYVLAGSFPPTQRAALLWFDSARRKLAQANLELRLD